jgi:hypothetical protein
MCCVTVEEGSVLLGRGLFFVLWAGRREEKRERKRRAVAGAPPSFFGALPAGFFLFRAKRKNQRNAGGGIPARSLAAENPIRSGRLHLMKSRVRVSAETPLLWDTEEQLERSPRPFAVGF